jgi:hypothetical protein
MATLVLVTPATTTDAAAAARRTRHCVGRRTVANPGRAPLGAALTPNCTAADSGRAPPGPAL